MFHGEVPAGDWVVYRMTNFESRSHRVATSPQRNSPPQLVYAVGIGPGNPSYVHLQARSILDSADVVIGFETVLDCIRALTGADVLSCGYETEAGRLAEFAERVEAGETGAAVLMGDPNFSSYSFLGKVEGAVDCPVRVVPGISSIQMAASRSRTPFESSVFVTLHTRGDLETEFDRLVRQAGHRNLLVLPRPYDYMPERIANVLIDRGVEASLDTHVHEHLSFDTETTTRTTLNELASTAGDDSAFSDLSVVVVRRRT